MDTEAFDTLQTRIIALEELVLRLVAAQPNAAATIRQSEASCAQLLSQLAATGARPTQTAALRDAAEQLHAHARIASGLPPP